MKHSLKKEKKGINFDVTHESHTELGDLFFKKTTQSPSNIQNIWMTTFSKCEYPVIFLKGHYACSALGM